MVALETVSGRVVTADGPEEKFNGICFINANMALNIRTSLLISSSL